MTSCSQLQQEHRTRLSRKFQARLWCRPQLQQVIAGPYLCRHLERFSAGKTNLAGGVKQAKYGVTDKVCQPQQSKEGMIATYLTRFYLQFDPGLTTRSLQQ